MPLSVRRASDKRASWFGYTRKIIITIIIIILSINRRVKCVSKKIKKTLNKINKKINTKKIVYLRID